jgi:hypothetical protein
MDYTIKGKVVVSPKFGPWWVLWIRVCLWWICAPKCSNYALTNLLFGLCRSMCVIEVLVNLPSSISELQHALLPLKCYELGNGPNSFSFRCSPLDSRLSPSRSLGGVSSDLSVTTFKICNTHIFLMIYNTLMLCLAHTMGKLYILGMHTLRANHIMDNHEWSIWPLPIGRTINH